MLRVDGMPEEFEAFRATFGGPLSCGRRELVFAEPREACEPLDKEQITGRYVQAPTTWWCRLAGTRTHHPK